MRFLILSSFLCFCLAACVPAKKITTGAQASATPFWTSELRDHTKKNEYRLVLETPKANITGIFLAKQMDGVWKGAILNEFGMKVLDFESSPNKCKLLNVISFINKWYIIKVVASDIQFIMEVDNPDFKAGVEAKREWVQDTLIVKNKDKVIRRLPDGEIKYCNEKRGLTYTLTIINATDYTDLH
jgi:hypothetical protein